MPDLIRDLHLEPRVAGKRGLLLSLGSTLPRVVDHLVDTGLPTPQQPFDYAAKVTGGFEIGLNNSVGDCTVIGIWHFLQLVFATLGQQLPYCGDAAILAQYCELLGCTVAQLQADPSLDTGLDLHQIIHAGLTTGLFGGQHKFVAVGQVDARDLVTQQLALYNFGSLYLGWDLPQIAEQEFANRQPWSLQPGANPGIGGHCTVSSGWNAIGFDDITWGAENQYTNDFARFYLQTCIVIVTQEMVDAGHGALANVNVTSLKNACQQWAMNWGT